MIKIENTVLPSGVQWKAIIMGARNPMNSWARSDSQMCGSGSCDICIDWDECPFDHNPYKLLIGDNDHELMMKLRNAGTDHRKFMRMIAVYVDITAPLYWWKEADTYSVGVVKNSCSTMHKIHAKEFTLEDFSCERLKTELSRRALNTTIEALNILRTVYLEGGVEDEVNGCFAVLDLAAVAKLPGDQYLVHVPKSKEIWDEMIQLLPSSYNQKRTVMLNYEVLANMYKSRKNHKLKEWRDLCSWIESLPYSELIIGEKEEEEKNDET